MSGRHANASGSDRVQTSRSCVHTGVQEERARRWQTWRRCFTPFGRRACACTTGRNMLRISGHGSSELRLLPCCTLGGSVRPTY